MRQLASHGASCSGKKPLRRERRNRMQGRGRELKAMAPAEEASGGIPTEVLGEVSDGKHGILGELCKCGGGGYLGVMHRYLQRR